MALPPRRATVAARPEVVVVGGGPAGIGAAVGAARAGADVLLAERYGFLGGNATVALVMPLMSWHNEMRGARERGADEPLRLLPEDHGPGEPVVGGVLLELMERLLSRGGAIAPSEDTGYTVPIDPEAYKNALLDDAGVRYLCTPSARARSASPAAPRASCSRRRPARWRSRRARSSMPPATATSPPRRAPPSRSGATTASCSR